MQNRTLITKKNLEEKVGETVILAGFVETKRDHGKITFIDLRDREGIVQCVGYKMMGEVTTESVVKIVGEVKARPEKMVNKEIETGGVEVEVKEYEVLSKAAELPMSLDTEGYEIGEETRLKYRYLDLRRKRMAKNLRARSEFVRAVREELYERGFMEIETPILSQATMEGARDFLVPSRLAKGKFYALPQSPQQYKQLLMAAGMERYFQIARCFRDEDLRADRLLELTQVDLEMSYVEKPEEVMEVVEEVVKGAIKKVGGKLQKEQFPVIAYQEAMKKYGADRFDLRSEKEKEEGILAFAWVVNFPFFKRVDKEDAAEIRDGKSGWTFTHNPFSRPLKEYEQDLMEGKNIENIITAQYDLVCNGYEVGGGSVRAHTPEMLTATYKIMGYSDEEIRESIGQMLSAFELGTPPHGGIALGLDRLMMVLAKEKSIKEVVAFPTTGSGRTAVMSAPTEASEEQLAELGIGIGKKV
ncbi:OB-fold nucleic acid binding domain-containing protein [Microgenomates group bacterium]|nr:OB-fold nucleic acid binding domain-containing protein [Microgenomates group bacterium]